jgi:Flp pilus assembly protein TadG
MNYSIRDWVPTYNRRERTMRTLEKRYMREIVRTPGCQQGTSATRRGRRERGQSLVETAIVAPILLLLLAAAIDFGRAFDTYIVLTNAAREGARFGSLAQPLTITNIKDLVYEDIVGSGTNITDMSSYQWEDTAMVHSTDFVTVTVSFDFDLWFGGLVGLGQLTLEKTAVMPRSQ